ncbi:hypothetical protein HPP92_008722 [Vanilla planifolia]|uniref:Uncharacterized protein n=1 Tax=Vanilla planifolia TaxID=51239 RepID=A0A835RII4_VANPL|nr:hypothetical protein HPP92_008722 [Vanilla planifolia]
MEDLEKRLRREVPPYRTVGEEEMFNTLVEEVGLPGPEAGGWAGGTKLDEGLMGKGAVSDEDGGLGTNVYGDDRAQPVCEIPEKGFDVWERGGNAEPVEVADKWKRRRAGGRRFFLDG